MSRYVFIDMDGTICDFGDNDGNCLREEFPKDYFLNKKPIKLAIENIRKEFKDDFLYILSCSPSTASTTEKNLWLNKNFPEIPEYCRVFIPYPGGDKVSMINQFINHYKLNPKDVVYIDDSVVMLKRMNRLGILCYHSSHFMVEN